MGEIMKKVFLCGFSLLLACSFANAEVVTNSKGENIELKSDGTWFKVQSIDKKISNTSEITKDDLLFSEKIITTNQNPLIKQIKNGEDKNVDVRVSLMVGIPDNIKSFDINKLNAMLNSALESTKGVLKNPYSFVPRKIQVIDDSPTLWYVVVEYTAKNSYGADVMNKRMFKFDQNGKIVGQV